METRKPITMTPIRAQPQPQTKVSQQEMLLRKENQELKKENQELKAELETKMMKERLLSEGEFRYQLLIQLNSIAEQINALARISSATTQSSQDEVEEYQESTKRDLLEGILPEPQQEEEDDDEDYEEPIKVPAKRV